MKRAFDLAVALIALIILALPLLLVGIAVRLESHGPALFWSQRVGRDNRLFLMPKFRSMRIDAPVLPTHLLTDGHAHVTRIGRFLRRSSIDELPQLWSVLTGKMSLVGPRPALFNQDDLISQRTAVGVQGLRPGLTGWAQVNGRDDLTIEEKVAFDRAYLQQQSFLMDLRIVWMTVLKVVGRSGIAH